MNALYIECFLLCLTVFLSSLFHHIFNDKIHILDYLNLIFIDGYNKKIPCISSSLLTHPDLFPDTTSSSTQHFQFAKKFQSNDEKKCSIRQCSERPLHGPHKWPLKEEQAALILPLNEDIESDDKSFSYSKVLKNGYSNSNIFIWDVIDSLRWCRKEAALLKRDNDGLQIELNSKKNSKPSNANSKQDEHEHPWPKYYHVCEKEWIRINPSYDAAYEMKYENLEKMKRLDGLIQPLNIIEKYELELCKTNDMQGVFRLKKKAKWCYDTDTYIASDVDTENLARSLVGEDTFRFQLEGAEIITLIPKPIGYCRYYLPYKMTIPGLYHINIAWWQERWNGVRDTDFIWYPGHLDRPFGLRNLTVVFGKQSYINEDPIEETKQMHKKVMAEYSKLPLCPINDVDKIRNGRWIIKDEVLAKISSSYDMFLNYGKGKLVRDDPDVIAMVDFMNYRYYPFNCKMIDENFEENQKKSLALGLKNKRISFVGDSQTRGIVAAFLSYHCSKSSIDELPTKTTLKEFCATKTILEKCNILKSIEKVCYYPESFGDHMDRDDSDFVFGNFGQHTSDQDNKWKTERFANQASMVAKHMSGYKGKFIWLETLPFPYRKDSYVRVYKDWRNNNRLRLLNKITNDNFEPLQEKIPIIPAFDQIHAWVLETPDHAHFPYPCLEGIVKSINHVLFKLVL